MLIVIAIGRQDDKHTAYSSFYPKFGMGSPHMSMQAGTGRLQPAGTGTSPNTGTRSGASTAHAQGRRKHKAQDGRNQRFGSVFVGVVTREGDGAL